MKNCPFCGSSDVSVDTVDIEHTQNEDGDTLQHCLFAIRCESCTACGPIKTSVEEASTSWDKRYVG